MPTRELTDLVCVITETIEQVLADHSAIVPDGDQASEVESPASGPVHAYVVDYEKIVWHYPDAVARLIEE